MQLSRSVRPIAVLALVVTTGCGGGGGGEDAAPASRSQTSGGATPSPAAGDAFGTATITGRVMFAGDAPEARTVKMNADPYCNMQHPQGATTNDVVVNDNGTLRWVFVHVEEGLGNRSYDVPTAPVVLDQRGCRYDPHVFGVMVDQAIKILNSDGTLHNVHGMPENSKPFNVGMPRKGQEIERKLRAPEVMVRIKCDVHPWMETWAGVVEHPFHAVTGDDGSFRLDRLPAGSYTIETWHEEYGTSMQSVTVGDGETAEITFTIGPAA